MASVVLFVVGKTVLAGFFFIGFVMGLTYDALYFLVKYRPWR